MGDRLWKFVFDALIDSQSGTRSTTSCSRSSTITSNASWNDFVVFHSATMIKPHDSQAQIDYDDTPIGQRPYPTANTRNYGPSPSPPYADVLRPTPSPPYDDYLCYSPLPGLAVVPDSQPLWDGRSIGRRPSAEITPGPALGQGNWPRQPSSDVEVVSGNFPRVLSREVKPVMQGAPGGLPRGGSSDVEIISANFTRVVSQEVKPDVKPVNYEPKTHTLQVSYTFYLPKGTDFSKGPPKKNSKTVYQNIPIPTTQQVFSITDYSFNNLKQILFKLASEVDNDPSKGNTAILKLAEASKTVHIVAFIARHHYWGKDYMRPITDDAQLEKFFTALPANHAGFIVNMDNPAKSAVQASVELTKSQGRLRAQNSLLHNTPTTASEVAHAAPIDPQKKILSQLQTRHSSLHTDKGEGWRIFNRRNLSLKMELTFRHLILWAECLALGRHPEVTMDDPPLHLEEDFFWVDVITKRPACHSQGAGAPTVKRAKVQDVVANVNAVVANVNNAVVANVNNNLADVVADVAHVNKDVANVSNDLAHVNNELANLKTELANVNKELANVNKELDIVKTQAHDIKNGLVFKIGTYAEMQGFSFNINYRTLKRIHIASTLEEYFLFCEIDKDKKEHNIAVLRSRGINGFQRFLFPESLSAERIASWGILDDTALELITRAREFYFYQMVLDNGRQERRQQREEDERWIREYSLKCKSYVN